MDDHSSAGTKFPCLVCANDRDSKSNPLEKTTCDGKTSLLNLIEKFGDDALKKLIENAWKKIVYS